LRGLKAVLDACLQRLMFIGCYGDHLRPRFQFGRSFSMAFAERSQQNGSPGSSVTLRLLS